MIQKIFSEKLNLPHLKMCFSSVWGSQHAHYRVNLRRALFQSLAQQSKSKLQMDNLLNLKETPQITGHSISISHCFKLGGFAFVDNPCGIGLDVVCFNRLNLKLIKRVSFPDELQQAPNPFYLWAAKESSFKSLMRRAQPQVVSGIKIIKWSVESENLFAFKIMMKDIQSPGKGLIYHENEHLISIFSNNL